MSIYEELIERVDAGEVFCIDFEKKTMKVGQNYLIKSEEDYTPEDLFGDIGMAHGNHSLGVILNIIEQLYHSYKYSLPSERSDSKKKKYFKSLSIEELTDEQLMCANRRETAQATLEGFILCSILTGKLTWDEKVMNGKWFWQSENDPDLVILRSWIENK